MEELVVLEVLDHEGRVVERVRLDSSPVTAGRAYGNDLIVDDPFVSPHHVRFYRDDAGKLVAEDLGSLNGLCDVSAATRVSRVAVASECRLRIGQTVLRLRPASYPVAPALPAAARERVLRSALGAWWGTATAFLVLAAYVVVDWYLGMYDRTTQTAMLTSALAATFVLAMGWAGVWAFIFARARSAKDAVDGLAQQTPGRAGVG